jgi:trypsin
MATISGWGATLKSRDNLNNLRAVDVPVIDTVQCRKAYSKLTRRMICAGYAKGGKDSCQGDSGGPMKRISDGVLIGVVSWGYECAEPNYPGVYSNVSSVRPWIQSITKVKYENKKYMQKDFVFAPL